jgi:sporulation protein YlmC with PRC-barrel domain
MRSFIAFSIADELLIHHRGSSLKEEMTIMRTFGSTAFLLMLATTIASAQTTQSPARMAPAEIPAAQVLTSIPDGAATITHWYKQSVYDQSNTRIGEIDDVLVDHEAKIVALLVGVGGFLGIGEKHVAVSYNAVRVTTKDNNKWYLVMNSTKDALKDAPGFKYDRSSMAWLPENAPATTGKSMPPTKPQSK